MPKLAIKEYCTGCTACAIICPQDCIKMIADENGFLNPVIDSEQCSGCGLCEKTCPIITPLKITEQKTNAYAAYSKDEMVRMSSSSGGIFMEIAKKILEHGGVVFGASYNDFFEITHICVKCETDLTKLRGAKYAQSNLHRIFIDVKKRLDMGQDVLFSGTPCQIGGLQAFLRKDYNNLLTMDFVCHGVPSPMVWKSYLEYRSKEDANGKLPYVINFRSKSTGWSKYQYSNVFEYENGKKYSALSSQSLFMKLFVGNYISRPSCENCKFKGYSRVSDFTLGDFWGIWDIDPEMDDNKGTSVILVHSEKGQSLWREISDKIKCKEVLLEQASQQNPSMLMSSRANPNRGAVLSKIRDGRIGECEELFIEPKVSMISKIKGKVKHILYGV